MTAFRAFFVVVFKNSWQKKGQKSCRMFWGELCHQKHNELDPFGAIHNHDEFLENDDEDFLENQFLSGFVQVLEVLLRAWPRQL